MDGGAETITRGTGNVFADLGSADAGEHQAKLRLAQAAAAAKLGFNQPESCRLSRTTSWTAFRSSG